MSSSRITGVDADDFDTRVASWLTLRHGQIAGRRVIAVDGKTMRGSRTREPGVHLLAALDQTSRAVIAQQRVAAKTNEIPVLPTLLADHDLDGVLVTADALHTQTATATWLRERGAHHLFTVKRNQSGLHKALEHLPWAQIPSWSVITCDHGRRVHRRIRIASRPGWITFPGASLVIQVRRRRSYRSRTGTTMNHSETIYLICSLSGDQAHPEQILAWLQGHWNIEALHWIRDVVFADHYDDGNIGLPTRLRVGDFLSSQVGSTAVPGLVVIAALLIVASVVGMIHHPSLGLVLLLQTALISTLGWRTLLYPHEMFRIPSVAVCLALFVLAVSLAAPRRQASISRARN